MGRLSGFRHADSGKRFRGISALLALTWILAGCGEDDGVAKPINSQEVKGKVVLANGKPLTKGTVVLWPQQEPMVQLLGKVQPDGTFTLKAGEVSVGVSHGDFLVSVVPEGYVTGFVPAKPKGLQYPAKYLSDQTSGLKVTITPETNELPVIELK